MPVARRHHSMLDPKTVLLVLLGVVAVGFTAYWGRSLLEARRSGSIAPTPYQLFVGLVTDFLDTLGIGSFATTTSFWRARKTIPDEHIPGTLNVGHTLPTVVQAFIYVDKVAVEMTTLVTMIAAAVVGSLVGAPIVSGLPRQKIQVGLGIALLVLFGVLVYRQFHAIDDVRGTIGVSGGLLVTAVVVNFVLGALMTIGVGLYAPCLVLVYLLGMDTGAGFPIMMASCAFLMPLASVPFIRRGSYSPRAALGLTLAGIPAVIVAALWMSNLIKDHKSTVNWIVAAVIVYTAFTLLLSARRAAPQPASLS